MKSPFPVAVQDIFPEPSRAHAAANQADSGKVWPSTVAHMPTHLSDAEALNQLGGWSVGEGPVTKSGTYPLV